MMSRTAVLIAWIVVGSASTVFVCPQELADPYAAAGKAYREKDYRAYLENLEKIRSSLPHNPRILEKLAGAYALNSQKDRALDTLRSIAGMGGSVDLAHKDFSSLSQAEVEPLRAAFEKNRVPAGKSRMAFRVEEKGLIPEGIAYDPQSRTFFLGSIHKNKILQVSLEGQAGDFAKSGQDGVREVLGMSVDPKRRVLWVCASYGGPATGDSKPPSAVFKYEIGTGRLLKRYDQPDTAKRLFNDIVSNAQGDVFFTDSEGGAVWKVGATEEGPSVLVKDRSFVYPNGLALSDDEGFLFVADQAGVWRIRLSDGKLQLLSHPSDVSVVGIDGMYWYKGDLIGVQNGFNPQRIIRFQLNQARDGVTGLTVLESNHQLFEIPTTGVIAEDRFYFIANSQLDLLDPKGQLTAPEKANPAIVLEVQL